ncbi:ABC transporter substrate-binding protein [Roseococcus sp. YIM B11640]|uniref:ABC transporter substrate-binding protein n=1 Tax=Roseococcus sp. YIM B11640 TaxID=3133973 RepID=UPI003C7E1EFB
MPALSFPEFRPTRRRALALGAGLLAAPAIARGAAPAAVRVTLPGAGSAGAIWRPLIASLPAETLAGVDIQWVGANPGQMQVQLLTGTLDVSVYGALGLVEIAARGADIVVFGPGLNNHGRWLVRADSPYQKPEDLIGKRIASTAETSETFKAARIASAVGGLDIRREMSIVFGPPAANQALFERGDVEGILTLEPTATRLIGQGAREIGRVADIWRQGTGETELPFLVGLAAQRSWVDQNRELATKLARIFAAANRLTRSEPQRVAELHAAYGIRENERAAIDLLPSRLADVYGTVWNEAVFASIDRQIEVAHRLGLVPAPPSRKLYVETPLTAA